MTQDPPVAATEPPPGTPPPPEAGPPRIPFVAVIAAVAGALILIVGGAIALRLVMPDANIIGLLVVEAAGLIFAVYAAVVRLPGIGWSGVGLRPAPAIWTWLAIPIAFGAMIVAAALTYAVLYAIGEIDTNPQLKALAPAAFGGLWAKLGLIAMAGLVVPFAEELLFRGVLYTWLRQHLGFIAVAVITSALFAVAHLLPSRVIGFFVVGMFAAYLREKSNSIWPSVVLHASFNSLNLAILLFLAPLLKDQLAG